MLGSLITLLLIVICVVQLNRKGGLVRGFILFVDALCASVVALNYYELLARMVINAGYIVEWAQPVVFIALFAVTFVVLALVTGRLISSEVRLPGLIDRIGASFCGIFLGLVIAGSVLIPLAMAPLSNKLPYGRFSGPNIDPKKPNKVLLNADGFVSSIFTSLSSGSFKGQRSFGVLHQDFIDQIFLNRLDKELPAVSGRSDRDGIEVPSKEAVWYLDENPIDASTGQEFYTPAQQNLMVVRITVRPKLAKKKESASFTLSQIRLLCKKSSDAGSPLTGSAESAYPVGYMKMPGKMKKLSLDDEVTIDRGDFISEGNTKARQLDLVFSVPNDRVPVMLQFRQNIVARLPRPLPAEEAPPTASFVSRSRCATQEADILPLNTARVHGVELTTGSKLLKGLKLPVNNMTSLRELESGREPMEIMLESNQIVYLTARLEEGQRNTNLRIAPDAAHPFGEMLRPMPGYQLLSMKGYNPTPGSGITAEQMPALVELSGRMNYPVGVITGGKVDERTIYQVDYCSMPSNESGDGLLRIAEDGSVAEPFSEVWLTEEVESMTEIYLLYLVEKEGSPIITSVWYGVEKSEVEFKNYEGFIVQ